MAYSADLANKKDSFLAVYKNNAWENIGKDPTFRDILVRMSWLSLSREAFDRFIAQPLPSSTPDVRFCSARTHAQSCAGCGKPGETLTLRAVRNPNSACREKL